MQPSLTLDPADELRAAGLRVTAVRLAVLEAVRQATDHPTVESIAARVRERIGAASSQAIYDAVGAFEARGLVRRIEPAGHPIRFEGRVGDNHHHLVCRRCGRAIDVACSVGAAPCLEPKDAGGFVVDQAEVTFWGICPACQRTVQRPEVSRP